MNADRQRLAANGLLGALGIGILAVMAAVVLSDGDVSTGDGGFIGLGFLSLREVLSKIENVTLGIRTPAPPVAPAGENG